MNFSGITKIAVLLLAAYALPGAPIQAPAEPPGPSEVFVLQDFRWVPVVVKKTPTSIDCHFEVISGNPTVHVELVSESDFRLFAHQRPYETLAATTPSASGGFHQMIEEPGRYRVLILNERGAPPAPISLVIQTDVDPGISSFPSGISKQRQLSVIAISLAVFFGTVFLSGRKLLFAWRRRRMPEI